MPGLYSFHKEENKKTRELTGLIQQFPSIATDVERERVNMLTLMWALIKDENYLALVACKTSAQLKKLLQSELVKLLRGRGHSITLNLTNYNRLKSDLNAFYKYLLTLGAFYSHHRIWINQEKTRKELKSKDASLPILLRQEQFAFRLQRLAALPKIQIQGSYETDRIEMSFEDKKNLDDFITFVTKDISETKHTLQHLSHKAADFGNFVRRRKETTLAFLFLALATVSVTSQTPALITSLFSPFQIMQESPWIQVEPGGYDPEQQTLAVQIRNLTGEPVEVLEITLKTQNGSVTIQPALGSIPSAANRTWFLSDVSLTGTNVLRILVKNEQGQERTEEIRL